MLVRRGCWEVGDRSYHKAIGVDFKQRQTSPNPVCKGMTTHECKNPFKRLSAQVVTKYFESKTWKYHFKLLDFRG